MKQPGRDSLLTMAGASRRIASRGHVTQPFYLLSLASPLIEVSLQHESRERMDTKRSSNNFRYDIFMGKYAR